MENLEIKEVVDTAKEEDKEVVAENKEEAKAEKPAPKKEKRYLKGKVTTLLRLREEDNVDANVILNMPKDSILKIDAVKSTEYFYCVTYKDPNTNKDVNGFAMKTFVEIIE